MWDFIIASSLPPYHPKLMCYTDVSKTFPLVWKLWPKSIKYFTEPQWSSSRENVCESPGNYGASDFLQKPFNCLDSGQLGAPTYIDLFAWAVAVLSVAMWPCCAQLHWHRAIRHCISNEMRYDHLPLAIPAPKRTHHTTHSSARDTVGDPDKFRECNVGLLPILISHSYPLTLPLTDGWSENSSVSGAPSSLPGHPTPRLPCGRKGTHQFHCF